MMIDDNARRRVAAELRANLEAMRWRESFYSIDKNTALCGNAAYRNIAGSVEENGNLIRGNYLHIVELLADLIDRPIEGDPR